MLDHSSATPCAGRHLDGIRRELRVPFPVHMGALFGPARMGTNDPRIAIEGAVAWWATRTPEGPGTARYVATPSTGRVSVQAWGPGATWLLDNAPHRLGLFDSLDGFDPSQHPVVAECAHRQPEVRFTATLRVFETMVPVICAQKITLGEAIRSYRAMVLRFGEPAPGPASLMPRMLLPPAASTMVGVPGWTLHPMGLERKRADTITRAAKVAPRLEEATAMERSAARARLQCVSGVSIWTSAGVAGLALGDADAVAVGDYHLKNHVVYALIGRARGTDAEMLELLAPFAGHRGRVARLLLRGTSGAPKFGPRLSPRPWIG